MDHFFSNIATATFVQCYYEKKYMLADKVLNYPKLFWAYLLVAYKQAVCV